MTLQRKNQLTVLIDGKLVFAFNRVFKEYLMCLISQVEQFLNHKIKPRIMTKILIITIIEYEIRDCRIVIVTDEV